MPKRAAQRVSPTPADLRKVADALLGILPPGSRDIPREPRSIQGLLAPLGATRTYRLTRGAMALSGTRKRSSKAYRAARRRLERYTTPTGAERRRRRPSREFLADLAKKLRGPQWSGGLDVQMAADVYYVGQFKPKMPAKAPQHLTRDELTPARQAWDAGEELEAAHEVLDAWVYAYGLATDPDARGTLGNIDWITIEQGNGEGARR